MSVTVRTQNNHASSFYPNSASTPPTPAPPPPLLSSLSRSKDLGAETPRASSANHSLTISSAYPSLDSHLPSSTPPPPTPTPPQLHNYYPPPPSGPIPLPPSISSIPAPPSLISTTSSPNPSLSSTPTPTTYAKPPRPSHNSSTSPPASSSAPPPPAPPPVTWEAINSLPSTIPSPPPSLPHEESTLSTSSSFGGGGGGLGPSSSVLSIVSPSFSSIPAPQDSPRSTTTSTSESGPSNPGTPTKRKSVLMEFHDKPKVLPVSNYTPRSSLFQTPTVNNPLPPVPSKLSSGGPLAPPPMLSSIMKAREQAPTTAPSTPAHSLAVNSPSHSPSTSNHSSIYPYSPPPPFSPPQPPPQAYLDTEVTAPLADGEGTQASHPRRHKRQGSGYLAEKLIPAPTPFISSLTSAQSAAPPTGPLFSNSSRRSSQDQTNNPEPPLTTPYGSPIRYAQPASTYSPFSPIAPTSVYPTLPSDSVPPSPVPIQMPYHVTTSPSISQVEGSPLMHLEPIPFSPENIDDDGPEVLFPPSSSSSFASTSAPPSVPRSQSHPGDSKARKPPASVPNPELKNMKRAVVRVHLPASKVIEKTLGFVTLLTYEKTTVRDFVKSIMEKLAIWEETPTSSETQEYVLLKHSASPIALRNDDTVFSYFAKELAAAPDEPLSLLLRPNVTRKSLMIGDSKELKGKSGPHYAPDLPERTKSGNIKKVLIRVEVPNEDLQEQAIDAVTLNADADTTCANFKAQILDKLQTVRKPGVKPKQTYEYILFSPQTNSAIRDDARVLYNIRPEDVGPGKILNLTLFTTSEYDELQKKFKEQAKEKSKNRPYVVGELPDVITIEKLPVTVYLPIQELHEVSADRVTILCLGETTVGDFQDKVLEKIESLRLPGAKKERKYQTNYYLAKTTDLDPLHPDSAVFKNFGLKELMTGKLEAKLISNAPDPLKGTSFKVEVPSFGKRGQNKVEGLMFVNFSVSMDSYTTILDAKRELARKIIHSGHIIRKTAKKEERALEEDKQVEEDIRTFDFSTEKTSQQSQVLDPTLNVARAFPHAATEGLTLYMFLKPIGTK